MGFRDFFKNLTEEEELDDVTGLPKHLIEREEAAFIKRKLYQEGKLHKKETKEDKKGNEKKICYECGFPYEIDNASNFNKKRRSFFEDDDDFYEGLVGYPSSYYSFLSDDDDHFSDDSSDDIFDDDDHFSNDSSDDSFDNSFDDDY